MKIKYWHIIGFVFTIAIGTLLHFTYEWSNQNEFVAIFSPINESVWEHLKMAFFPMLIFAIIEYFFYGKNVNGFIPVKAMSICISIALIVVLFYTYTGIIGKNYMVADIATFFIAVFYGYYYSYKALPNNNLNTKAIKILSLIIIILIL
ncbi:MAG: DUF6512 family protein, partial [Oscillospiraceae bacterium]